MFGSNICENLQEDEIIPKSLAALRDGFHAHDRVGRPLARWGGRRGSKLPGRGLVDSEGPARTLRAARRGSDVRDSFVH